MSAWASGAWRIVFYADLIPGGFRFGTGSVRMVRIQPSASHAILHSSGHGPILNQTPAAAVPVLRKPPNARRQSAAASSPPEARTPRPQQEAGNEPMAAPGGMYG